MPAIQPCVIACYILLIRLWFTACPSYSGLSSYHFTSQFQWLKDMFDSQVVRDDSRLDGCWAKLKEPQSVLSCALDIMPTNQHTSWPSSKNWSHFINLKKKFLTDRQWRKLPNARDIRLASKINGIPRQRRRRPDDVQGLCRLGKTCCWIAASLCHSAWTSWQSFGQRWRS